MRIKVAQGVQVVYDGKVYESGDTADVPDAVAQFWIRSSWVSAVPRPKANR